MFTHLSLSTSDGDQGPDYLCNLLGRLFRIISGWRSECFQVRNPRADILQTSSFLSYIRSSKPDRPFFEELESEVWSVFSQGLAEIVHKGKGVGR
jgi:hypothetical protein